MAQIGFLFTSYAGFTTRRVLFVHYKKVHVFSDFAFTRDKNNKYFYFFAGP